MNNILEQYPEAKVKSLGVGEGVVATRPLAVSTVLGSCVAVTFHCPATRIGAVFHALLPEKCEYSKSVNDANCRFVDSGITHFLRALTRAGAHRSSLVCKVFGGAHAMFAEEFGVGRRNVQVAYESLERERLRIAASDVGGDRGRKLVFMTHTGEVFVKRLRQSLSQSCPR